MEMVQLEQGKTQSLFQEATEHLNISEQDFMRMEQQYLMDPSTQQKLMEGQISSDPSKVPKISRQKTVSVFIQQETEKVEQFIKQQTGGAQMGGDPMMVMILQQAKQADSMFEKEGIEEEEFHEAIMFYNVMHDPAVK